MFNIDDTVYVKGIITGVQKDGGKIKYTVQIEDTNWHEREVTVVEEDAIKFSDEI